MDKNLCRRCLLCFVVMTIKNHEPPLRNSAPRRLSKTYSEIIRHVIGDTTTRILQDFHDCKYLYWPIYLVCVITKSHLRLRKAKNCQPVPLIFLLPTPCIRQSRTIAMQTLQLYHCSNKSLTATIPRKSSPRSSRLACISERSAGSSFL